MRKLFIVLGVVALLAIALAAPAQAQLRDPFDPLIQEGGSVGTTTSGTGTTVAPAPQTPVFGDGLANTGADTSSWMILAYVLIAGGTAAVALSGVLRKPAANRL